MVDGVGGGSTQKPGGVLSESVPTMAMRCDDETRSDLAFIRAARIYRTLIDPFLVNAQSACYTLGVIQHHQECLVPIVGSPRAARMGHVGVEGVSGLAFRYAVSVVHSMSLTCIAPSLPLGASPPSLSCAHLVPPACPLFPLLRWN